MKHEQFLDNIIKTLADWKGKTDVAELQRGYSETTATLERFRQWACDLDSDRKALTELLVEFSKGSLRALLLINTGGIFVVMTLTSSMISKNIENIKIVQQIANEAIYFVYGVSVAVVTVMLSYLGQWIYTSFEKNKYGMIPNILAMITGVASFGFFLRGAIGLQNVFCNLAR